MRFLPIYIFAILSLCLGCDTKITTLSNTTQVSEEAYCTKSCVTDGTCTGTTVSVSGTALYERRLLTAAAGLGGRDTTGSGTSGNFPIRGAEFQVLKNGALFHCGTTSSTGTYSFDLPDDGETYTIKVNSRAYTTNNKASVLDTPSTKSYYSISTTVTATGPGPLTANVSNATYNGTLTGGAFNILDKIYQANEFLKTEVSGFTVSEKVSVYWKKGVNPASYVGGDPDTGLSFYIRGTDALYILGGIDGDVNSSDTDHFDDSIIVHEYGHFLEDNYATSNSPGGSHNGRRIIDPRLAWSEAFASFMMAVVLEDPIYRDTVGNSDGTSYYAIHYNMETNSLSGGINKLDTTVAGNLGEGNFREFAIGRLLVDLFDNISGGLSDSDADGVTISFQDFWDVYSGNFTTTEDFADVGHLLKLLDAAVGTDFSSLLIDNAIEMRADRQEYGFSNTTTTSAPDLITGGGDSNCEWDIEAEDQPGNSIAGRDEIIDDGTSSSMTAYELSNQFKSNDFFLYYHPGGTLSVTLTYTPASSTTADLDLYIYKTDYDYGDISTMIAYSNDPNGEPNTPDDNGTESVSASAPEGYYMINVMYWTQHIGTRSSASTSFADSAKYSLRIGTNKYFCR